VPVSPTWEQVSLAISGAEGAQPAQLRARAILLLAIYGIRSGELRRLRLDDIDWRQETIRFQRSESGRRDIYPLEATVGNAILDYLRHARRPHGPGYYAPGPSIGVGVGGGSLGGGVGVGVGVGF